MSARGSASLLFTPITLRSVTVRNRVMVSPMCQYSAPQAVPHDWHYVHLATRAVGGAGIVSAEATAVEPIGRITPYDLGLWDEEQQRAFAQIAAAIAEHGAVPAIQLAHAGRKASHRRPWEARAPLRPEHGGWDVIGPSPLPWEHGDLMPRAMTVADIERTIERFAASARRALAAGFRLLELHAAHGYLLHSFLSPISNARVDRYGGSFSNRVRFLLETVCAVREAWPAELPLSVRISATDWVEGGWTLDDSVRLARLLAARGADIIDCSSGGSTRAQSITPEPGYQVALAETVRSRAGVMTAAVGLISDPLMAEDILLAEKADLVVLGRIALWDPYWPHHAAAALGIEPQLPLPYARSAIYGSGISAGLPARAGAA
jgi:2,4-dienoyl-CoA reductase-like NADH-dependent reductase (Old Yellow Enzyme family)